MLEQVTWFAHTHHQSPQSRVASVFAHGRRTGPVRVQQDHLRRRGRQAHSDVDPSLGFPVRFTSNGGGTMRCAACAMAVGRESVLSGQPCRGRYVEIPKRWSRSRCC